MPDQFITSAEAVAIWRDLTKRPNATRSSLSYWTVRGFIRAKKIHTTCWVYHRDDVEMVAKRFACGGAE